ncbi:fructosamine kinase family protein [Catenovulum sediminis]|uniref:Fructosamine kinase family protein n=1 Tax=Catenovulum sediminis TaxID=1740262 RepID=A0ABV1RLW6_9ALTE|nr:fructosamine kinase family protein [Catenovulum sediminis]
MWHQIETSIQQALLSEFNITNKQAISGGDISSAYQIMGDNGQSYFVKLNKLSFIENFLCEAANLEKISRTDSLYCPQVITYGSSKNYSFLVLEWLDFTSPKMQEWHQAGQALAQMHMGDTQAQFGYEENNYIGKTIQPNPWHNNWSTFFAEQRIGHQLELLNEKGVKIGDIDDIVALVHSHLKPRKPDAMLLHGDLWRGNISFIKSRPVVYDPACYYGDHETDLAMTELFGKLPREFYQGYEQILPIDTGYNQRKHIYNFYHILNHANLFGGSYIDQCRLYLHTLSELKL